MNDNKNKLREDAIEFALEVSSVCDGISGCSVFTAQLLRSSSSIGANLFEAKYAQSLADFINKLEVSLKECSETEYWLLLIYRKQKIKNETFKKLYAMCGTLKRRLIASVMTAKSQL